MDCSGLAILSRHEITEVDFLPFDQNHGKNSVEVNQISWQGERKKGQLSDPISL